MHAANATLDWSGDLRSEITRYHSKKPPSRVTTRCDEWNQTFLEIDCDRLQGPFTSPHSLSVNGNRSIALGKIMQSMLPTATQDSQYTVDNAHIDN